MTVIKIDRVEIEEITELTLAFEPAPGLPVMAWRNGLLVEDYTLKGRFVTPDSRGLVYGDVWYFLYHHLEAS